jgi:hypothetical protein
VTGSRLLAPFLAGATLILLGANALPTSVRKKRLLVEATRLRMELRVEQERCARVAAEIDALRNDPWYRERLLVETWRTTPAGARRLADACAATDDGSLYEE